MRLCLVYPLQDNLLKLKISEGARTQIMTRGPFWLSTALPVAKASRKAPTGPVSKQLTFTSHEEV